MESEKLRNLITQMATLAREAIGQLSEELYELKSKISVEKELISSHSSSVLDSLDKLVKSSEIREREALQRLTVDHELEQSDLKKLIQGRNEEIQSLRAENQCLERSLIKYREETRLQKDEYERLLNQSKIKHDELQKQIDDFEVIKEKAVKDCRDELQKEYKAELDSMRSRFKLMSLMERSPSDSSLEKIDHNVIDLVRHNAIIEQLKQDLAAEKDKAVNEAVDKERLIWESRLEQEIESMKIRSEAEKQVSFYQMI